MKTVHGNLMLNGKERKALEIMLKHVKRDISYGEGGTFSFDDAEDVKKVETAIEVINFILEITK